MVHLRIAHYGFVQNNSNEYDTSNKRSSLLTGNTKQRSKSPLRTKLIIHNVSNSQQPDKKQWQCDICSKTFTTKYFLKKHKRLHTGKFAIFIEITNYRYFIRITRSEILLQKMQNSL